MRRVGAIGAAIAVAAGIAFALAWSAVASASPFVHAHRGGPLATVHGELRPAYPENSLPAFRHAAKAGFVLEMDTRVTADGRAVIMHDASLNRTTNCTGLVSPSGRSPRSAATARSTSSAPTSCPATSAGATTAGPRCRP